MCMVHLHNADISACWSFPSNKMRIPFPMIRYERGGSSGEKNKGMSDANHMILLHLAGQRVEEDPGGQ